MSSSPSTFRRSTGPVALVLPVLLLAAACSSGDGEPDRGSESGTAAAASGAYDWLIAGGTVIDGTGEPGRRADVLVRGGRIAWVGAVDPDTLDVRERYDASGLVVAPGFIDAHAHGDPVENPAFSNFLAMGVTTIILGQDGGSPEVGELSAQMDAIDAVRPGVNVAFLVGHNTVRRESGVGYEDPGSEGLVRMSELVTRGLEAGAFGLSTGLEYDPGSRSGIDELAAIARPVAAARGVVVSHVRNEDADAIAASMDELIEQGRRSGARVHVSHMKIVLGNDTAQAVALLGAMERARQSGVEITADVYPYTASFTGIGILFPEWARPPNDYVAVVRERRDALAEHLRTRVGNRNGPEATLFGAGDWSGRTLAEVAEEQMKPFEDVLIDLGPDGAQAAYFVMNERVMAKLLSDPHVVVSSDGSPTMQHPRGHGSFSRVIRRYVEEEPMLSLEAAVRKMSGLTASIYGLDDSTRVAVRRGEIRAGWAADLLVFDPTEVKDVADFEHPHRLSEGMRAIWVGGVPAWRNGRPDGNPVLEGGSGQVLRARR